MSTLSSHCRWITAPLAGIALAAVILSTSPTQAHERHCCWGWGVGAGVVGAAALWGWPGYYYPYGPYPYGAPVTVITPPAEVVVQPAAAPTYYYCTRPQGYYPYVPSCQVPWQAVPATPPAH